MGTEVELQGNLVRDVAADRRRAAVAGEVTPAGCREANAFTWGPILEVAKLFIGIFITIVPVIAILRPARQGAFSPLVRSSRTPDGKPDDVGISG
jgi:hypothetical protein